jgi:hypothetical protein
MDINQSNYFRFNGSYFAYRIQKFCGQFGASSHFRQTDVQSAFVLHPTLQLFPDPLPAIMFFISALLSLPCMFARLIFFVSIFFKI